jgi:hypothetical protein
MAERVGVWALHERLGEGAFSTVWLGVRPDGSRAAVRVFRSEPSARVQRADIAVIATVRHPNIPELIEFGDDSDGRLYTATRYVAGESLRRRLERGALAPVQVLALGRALAGALAALHRRRLVHRDVKPDNILIPDTGALADAQLTDLWLMGELQAATNTTQAGVLVGTPAYMAPEQITGGGVGPPADVWALGAVLFEALTGRRRFEGSSALDVMKAILLDAPAQHPLPAPFGPITAALQRDPAQRPSAVELERLFAEAERPIASRSTDAGRMEAVAETAAAPVAARGASAPARRAPRAHVLVGIPALVLIALWLLWSTLGWPAALAAAAGVLVAALVVALARRSRARPVSSAVAAAAGSARQTAALASDRAAVTRSVALAVDELVATVRSNPHASLLTASMAMAIDGYESAALVDPEKRLDATLRVLDILLQLERRMQEVQAPWYVRHEKPLAFISALGSAGAIWLGLSKDLLVERDRGDGLILGCPTAPVTSGTQVSLEAADRRRTLVWSMDGKPVLVGASFRWPTDANARPVRGNYVVHAAPSNAPDQRERCLIEVSE